MLLQKRDAKTPLLLYLNFLAMILVMSFLLAMLVSLVSETNIFMSPLVHFWNRVLGIKPNARYSYRTSATYPLQFIISAGVLLNLIGTSIKKILTLEKQGFSELKFVDSLSKLRLFYKLWFTFIVMAVFYIAFAVLIHAYLMVLGNSFFGISSVDSYLFLNMLSDMFSLLLALYVTYVVVRHKFPAYVMLMSAIYQGVIGAFLIVGLIVPDILWVISDVLIDRFPVRFLM